MFLLASAFTQVVFTAAAGLVMIAGATIALCLAFLFQRRPESFSLAHLPTLACRPFTLAHASLVVLATLLFVVSSLVQPAGAQRPSDFSLIIGPLFYAFSGLLVTAVCLYMAKSSFREAFAPPASGTRSRALACGSLFGLAAIPAIILLSLCMASMTESLGYKPQLQEVFDWLNDDSISWHARGFLMVAAVVVAPLVEETLFRGILLPALMKGRSFASAALLSGLYFALIHLHAPSLLPLLVLSVAFSTAYAVTGSLLTPIVMHALFNLTSLFIFLGGCG